MNFGQQFGNEARPVSDLGLLTISVDMNENERPLSGTCESLLNGENGAQSGRC
jgi:hypothetical protein